MLLDDKEHSTVHFAEGSSSIPAPSGLPPSYSESVPRPSPSTGRRSVSLVEPASSTAAPPPPSLPFPLANAPRSSHYSHCASGLTPINHTHLFETSRAIPEALLPRIADRPEAKSSGERVAGFFFAERGDVKVVAGVLGSTSARKLGSDGKRKPVRIVCGSGAERMGEGEVSLSVLSRYPASAPLSLSLTSTTGALRLLLPPNYRGHITHLFLSTSDLSSSIILSPRVLSLYTPLSNTPGFIGEFDSLSEDPQLDDVLLSTGGRTITVGFAGEEVPAKEEDQLDEAQQLPVVEDATTPLPTAGDLPSLSSALTAITWAENHCGSTLTRLWHSFVGPFLLGLVVLLLALTVYGGSVLLRGGPKTLQHLDWDGLVYLLVCFGAVGVAMGLVWVGWALGMTLEWPDEIGFLWRRLKREWEIGEGRIWREGGVRI